MTRKLDARGMEPEAFVRELRPPGGFFTEEIRNAAREIVREVRERGDAALLEYTGRFDGVRPDPLRVPLEEIDRAVTGLLPDLRESFRVAIENVRRFHEAELDESWSISRNGATVGQRVRPLDRVGLYVPGGHGAYPSTLIMSAVPAQVAGVREIAVCSPPDRDGRVSEAVLAVAGLLGLDEVYAVGGAQAVAALAYGTESIPAVRKISGPGNDYVTAAKLEVFGTVGIDAPQGPSEVVVIADEAASPERVAYDLLAQAEHLSGASAVLLTPDAGLMESVGQLLSGEPARLVTLVLVRDISQAVELSNAYAPEHAHVLTGDAAPVTERLTAAGCVMVGDATPVALGDYAAGPSHALPTGGTAVWASPLGTHDFTVRSSYIRYTPEALRRIGPHVARLARLEGFENHARSVEVRLRAGFEGG
ncbi:histidinol dehydrogenase [Rubrobacter taiwanensis]|uniref:Histidinol dehydrogenase n=1 Tax=Rubrobacter taiwanensis TaxID=185139 RepID=A0A4V2NX78_9ACTN|nr:histidinol dehydrogenase [Rubrobacter taiwanensis]TCJ20212.1 histidinol dehydrogenase [Rubrobacter taiwanensis]